MQVALQAAYHVGHMAWAETENARLVLQLLGFPRVRNSWDFALVRFVRCVHETSRAWWEIDRRSSAIAKSNSLRGCKAIAATMCGMHIRIDMSSVKRLTNEVNHV